jgi:hypothetical protein
MNAPATARLTVCRAADLARGSAVALLGLLVSIAVILGWRRAAGAIAIPLDLPGLLLAALLVATCAAGTRLAWLSAAGSASAGSRRVALRVDIALAALVSLVVLAIGLLVRLPGTTLAGTLVLWIALAAEELCTWRLVVARRPLAALGATAGLSSSARPAQSPPASVPGEEVLQQLTRSRTADGGELLSGWLRVDLAAGQRTANLHVAFCPPFARAPRISVQQVDGPEARVKTVQTLPYGVRFDLKVADEGPEAATLLLQFAAAVSAEAGSPRL